MDVKETKVNIIWITNSTVQDTFREADSLPTADEIPRLLWGPNLDYLIQTIMLLDPLHPTHTLFL